MLQGVFKAHDIDAIAKGAQSKATIKRITKSLSSHQLKSAISNLQSALKAAEAREAEKDNKRRAANIKKLLAKMGLSPSSITGKALRKSGKKRVKQSKASAKSKVGPKKEPKSPPNTQSPVKAQRINGPAADVCR